MVCNCMLVYVWAMVMISVSPLLVNAHICSDDFLIKAESLNIITNCNLLSLGAEFAWKFDNTSRQLDVAVGARLESPTAWLAWGLNPDGPHMAGTRTLMGVKHQTGLAPRKFNITDATKRHCMLRPSDNIGLNITNFTFSYLHDIMYYMIRATIILPDSYNASRANIVWQIGEAAVSADKPRMHSTSLDYLDASRTINLITGERLSLDPNQRTRMRTMTALRLKPKRADEYRTYWNMYHHFLGYSLIVVAAVNIFQGISIIESGAHHHWRWSYVGALGLMGAVATSLELYSWLKFRKATKNRESLKITQSSATAPEPHS
ncbi:cytochrome b561 and DOMON domain-containing protein At5g47530-like isoform X2 [Salvia splendens]|uniref:cytochrome b561 and DOMON domain-containing protein At5g47530-like isoform X2 n=1 Tax=Salvia splendens TaxID=180675 RepID=UPI001C25EC2C|nr:cytochrome b561 and DOMON domain-containing protein At5g47530-like isoform X2 [Salvia splendens]